MALPQQDYTPAYGFWKKSATMALSSGLIYFHQSTKMKTKQIVQTKQCPL
jgi:hypothetical protein